MTQTETSVKKNHTGNKTKWKSETIIKLKSYYIERKQ